MDKMTNGFVKIPKGQEADVQLNIKWHFEDLVMKEYGVKAKAKVKLIPIEEVITKKKDRLNFTHAYQVRIRGWQPLKSCDANAVNSCVSTKEELR